MSERDRERTIRRKLVHSGPLGPPAVIPTGFTALDRALGAGGLPRGSIVELFGGASSGKSTLALQMVAHAQSAGFTAAWVDAEHALDAAWASALGVAIEQMPVAKPETAEQALEMARQLAASRAVDLVVVDSAAALIPRLELEAGIGDSGPGLQSRVLASGLRPLAHIVSRSGAVVVFLNQLRSRPEIPGEEPETTAGGPPLKLHAAVRIALEPRAPGRIRFRILKNKAAEGCGEGDLRVREGGGFEKSP